METEQSQHGLRNVFVEGEGFLVGDGEPDEEFRFSRLFPDLEKFRPDKDALIELGEAMTTEEGAEDERAAKIPAGFTYLGQFIDHDITMDEVEVLKQGPVDPEMIHGGRSPSLDLDSIYLRGPEQPDPNGMYDGIRLRIGQTIGRGVADIDDSLPNDLPRLGPGKFDPDGNEKDPRLAAIGDGRNDENLIVGQTHLAFLQFHNKVVSALSGDFSDTAELFLAARKEVTLHYQSLLFHDFLKRMVDPAVHEDVLANGRKHFYPNEELGLSSSNGVDTSGRPTLRIWNSGPGVRQLQQILNKNRAGLIVDGIFGPATETAVKEFQKKNGLSGDGVVGRQTWRALLGGAPDPSATFEHPSMPLEFSGAAYRFGHTLITNEYEWNRVFRSNNSPFPNGTLSLLFRFSGGGGLDDAPTLSTDWIIDWTRFHDFSEVDGVDSKSGRDFNFTRQVDAHLAINLGDLPTGHKPPNLAVLNLLRSHNYGLPTGQAVAEAIGVPQLTADELAGPDSPHGEVLKKHNFENETPLWYYILREGKVHHDGHRLGAVGSRIVMEVFHGLSEGSRISLLKNPDWKPKFFRPGNSADHYSMAHLLAFVDDVNPLGD